MYAICVIVLPREDDKGEGDKVSVEYCHIISLIGMMKKETERIVMYTWEISWMIADVETEAGEVGGRRV